MRLDKQTPIHIAIADDHALIRKAISNIISSYPGFTVSIEADNGRELISKIELGIQVPDICVLDISMKQMNGFDTLEVLKNRWPHIKTLMLTMFSSEFNITKALKAGADGFMMKDSDPDDLHQALKDIYNRKQYFPELIADKTPAEIKNDKTYAPKITEREMEFLSLCCKEYTYAEIATLMGVGLRTVDSFRENLFVKLHVSSRTGLVAYAFQNGIIPLS